MTLSGQPAMGSNIPPMPVMQQQPTFSAPPMFAGQQPVSPQQPAVVPCPDLNQQPPQFGMQPVAPQHVPQQVPPQIPQQMPQQIPQQMLPQMQQHVSQQGLQQVPQHVPQQGLQQVPQQAPQFTPPPADSAHALRISKLAEYTSRNGPAFEEQVRTKQALNPEYSFLQGGEGSNYYQWCLFCYAKGIPIDQPQQVGPPMIDGRSAPSMMFQQQGGLPPPAAMPAAQQHIPPPVSNAGGPTQPGPIPPEVASGIAHVLHVLQGSQVWSTRNCAHILLRSLSVGHYASSAAHCGLGQALSPGRTLHIRPPPDVFSLGGYKLVATRSHVCCD